MLPRPGAELKMGWNTEERTSVYNYVSGFMLDMFIVLSTDDDYHDKDLMMGAGGVDISTNPVFNGRSPFVFSIDS